MCIVRADLIDIVDFDQYRGDLDDLVQGDLTISKFHAYE